MRIAVYCEPLRTATTGTPMRNMVKELLKLRPDDLFLMIVRRGFEKDRILANFFSDLEGYNNWTLCVEPVSRKVSNLLGILKYRNYCRIRENADVYLNTDVNTLGKQAHPLIITVADMSSFRALRYTSYKRNWQLWLRRFMLTNGIKWADHIVAISEFTKRDILGYFPDVQKKISVIYNGINPLWFQPAKDPGNNVNAYWIWWGHISDRKNLLTLFEAYAALRKESETEVPVFRVIYSNDKIPPELEHFVFEHQLKDKIVFERSKPFDELVDIVSSSKGLLFPSFVEGFGMPVVEAMARGVPVLTSDTSALKEVSGGLAIYVNPGDECSVKNGLLDLLDTGDENISRHERIKWAGQFSIQNAAQRFSKLIDLAVKPDQI